MTPRQGLLTRRISGRPSTAAFSQRDPWLGRRQLCQLLNVAAT